MPKDKNNKDIVKLKDVDEEEVRKDVEKSFSLIRVRILIVAIVAILFCIAIVIYGTMNMEKPRNSRKASNSSDNASSNTTIAGQVAVPDLVGMNEQEAVSAANALSLGVKCTGEESGSGNAGTILAQNPEAGTLVSAHTTIQYTRIRHAGNVIVTDVSGQLLSDAENTLKNDGFYDFVITKKFSGEDCGTVLGTTPSSGQTADTSDTLLLTVSRGKTSDENVLCENYTRMKADEAVLEASANGVIASVQYGYSDNVDDGIVYMQSVDPGSPVAQGAGITLYVSSDKNKSLSETVTGTKNVYLNKPSNYTGKGIRYTFIKEVREIPVEITIAKEEKRPKSFPYEVSIPSQTDGTILMEEIGEDGTYIQRAAYHVKAS